MIDCTLSLSYLITLFNSLSIFFQFEMTSSSDQEKHTAIVIYMHTSTHTVFIISMEPINSDVAVQVLTN